MRDENAVVMKKVLRIWCIIAVWLICVFIQHLLTNADEIRFDDERERVFWNECFIIRFTSIKSVKRV